MYHIKIAERPDPPKSDNPIDQEAHEVGLNDTLVMLSCVWFHISEIDVKGLSRKRLRIYAEPPSKHGNSAMNTYELNPTNTEVYVMNDDGKTIESFLWRRQIERIVN